MDLKLKDKVVLITGGNSGIGAKACQVFAEEGASVVVHYLESQPNSLMGEKFKIEHTVEGKEAAEKVVENILEKGGKAISVSGDLSKPEDIAKIYDDAEKEFERVDILVNNAAHCEMPDTILSADAGNIDRHFEVNVRGAVLMIAEFAKRFKKRQGKWGRVINISTDAAQNFPTQISYGASKATLEAYTRSLAYELGALNITVNAVAPGPVQTGWITPEMEKEITPHIPIGRVGLPEDIAYVLAFLASEQTDWLTGQVIKVSGGHAI